MDVIYLLAGAGFFAICWALAVFTDKLKEQ
jgi:hypothetical protein